MSNKNDKPKKPKPKITDLGTIKLTFNEEKNDKPNNNTKKKTNN